MATAEGFGDRLVSRVTARKSQLVLGLDPDPARLWPRAIELADRIGAPASSIGAPASSIGAAASSIGAAADAPASSIGAAADAPGPPAARAARAVAAHCALVIEAVADQCVAVKLQVACFERLGAPGWAALSEVVSSARERELLVIADAKRADIDVTSEAYAQAFLGETQTAFGPVPGIGADALTVNPLLGADSLRPLLLIARERGRGLFVLVRTSNPGASDVQELPLATGGSVSDRLAAMVTEIGVDGVGVGGISDVGAVVGATAPERIRGLRAAMPHTPFLLPGVGAQGGRVEELAAAFAPGPAGGLIAVSRGIVNAYQRAGGDPASAASEEAGRLRELAWNLANEGPGASAIV